MIELKEVYRWIKTTLIESLREAIKKVLVYIFVVIIIIAVLLLWIFWERAIMLLTHEVAIFWFFVVAIPFLIALGISHHKNKKQLEEKTKQDAELVKKFKLGFPRCEFETDESVDNPKVLITQGFLNIFVEQLKLSNVEIIVKANGIELDEFSYSPPNRVQQLGDKIKTSSTKDIFSKTRLNCWIRFETTKLRQVIPDYHGKVIKIDVHGKIQFATGTSKIDKAIEETKSITFKSKRERIVS